MLDSPDIRPTAAPRAARVPTSRTFHGRTFTDPYEWLRDPEDPGVRAYLEAENAWFEACTADQEDLRRAIVADIAARTRQTDLSVPVRVVHEQEGTEVAYWYYQRIVTGWQYPVQVRRVATGGPDELPPRPEEEDGEEIVFDMNEAAEGHDHYSLGLLEVSPDGRLLAWSEDTTGAERFTLHVRDLRTGTHLPDVVDDIAWGGVWAGNSALVLTRCDDAWRPYQVLVHTLGSAGEEVVQTETDERFWLGVDASRDHRWIIIGSASKESSEVRLVPADDPYADTRPVLARRPGLEYDVEVGPDRLWITHNASLGEPAVDFAVATADLDTHDLSGWTPIVLPVDGVRVLGVDAYADHQVIVLRRDGQLDGQVIGAAEWPTDPVRADRLPGRALSAALVSPDPDAPADERLHTVSLIGLPDLRSRRVRASVTSLIDPPAIVELSLTDAGALTDDLTVLRRMPVLAHPERGPYRREDYVRSRLWATAEDGTRIPVSLVHHRSVTPDGTAPALLYGYGAYEISLDDEFSIPRLSLLDRGFVVAIAHVRGGGEFGRSWYEGGRRTAKAHTFTDFIACARALVDAGWTSPNRLVAEGGSAGGLLAGAVATMAPGLFAGVLAEVPFVDPLTTMLHPELPLTVTERDEWGDPMADPAVYDAMAAYSPYENVAARRYPKMLVTTGLNDTRVAYVEPAKWVAALRSRATNDDRDILLRVEMGTGHGGVTGRYARWEERARELAWVITTIGDD